MNAVADQPVAAPNAAQTHGSASHNHVAIAATHTRRRKPRSLHRSLLRPLLGSVAVIAVAVTASWWFTEGRWVQSTDDAYVQGDIAVLSPRIEGNVAAINVADNQFVHAGDALIQLDPADWQARLAQAHAMAAEADAAVVTARRQLVQQQSAIAAATAAVAQAQADQTRAAADAGRSAALAARGWASHQADDLAVAEARKSAAALASAQAQLQSAQQQLAVLAAELTQAEAKQQNAAAAERLAANNLSYTVIRAPFDGIVGNRAAQLGQHVAAGTQLIALAPPPAKLYVIANFKETQLRLMRKGMPVRLVPDINPDAAVDGRVDSLAPATGALFSLLPPENATGNFTKVVQRVPVKIALDAAEADQAGWLRAGLSVTAEVDTRGPGAERLGLFGAAAATARNLVP
jgi:membrane fusion protein (multidrug efflux system)